MENQIEEENKPKKNKFILTNPDWLDLPDLVTNIILERLEIVDYIRFPAVCKKWQSMQYEHGIRHFPCPPPSPLPFPWLGCEHCVYKIDGVKSDCTFLFHVLDKQKSYDIPVFSTFYITETAGCEYGWLFFKSDQSTMHILNPITGAQIKLPPTQNDFEYRHASLYISSPPTDPDCTLLVQDRDGKFFLHRLNDKGDWKIIKYRSKKKSGKTIFCGKKIYHAAWNKSVIMIDTLLPDPTVQTIEMDSSEICAPLHHKSFDLVDLLGELVMVITADDFHHSIEEFHVYRANFLTNRWERMRTLGDGVMFYSMNGMFALRADDVACKKNTIYTVEVVAPHGFSWRAFDVSARYWTYGPPLPVSSYRYPSGYWFWFLPTLDYCLHASVPPKGMMKAT